MQIPDDFHPLLNSTAVAMVSTLGPHGEPQVTPIWFMFDGDAVRFSLVDGRQKLRNIQRDPRVAVLVVNPALPTYYLELRGTAELVEDQECELERAVSVKYTGSWTDGEAAGTNRYAATVRVERTTSQRGHGAE
ncbi:MAG TPA: PPOX class F420-dependent oxidoreductase [Ilumatobacteraceae bacterium]|nr:PPOX class F420-dependent oxidoreductase [Ilumatobacteraceae bacterium]